MLHIPNIMQTSGANKYIVNDKINDFIKLVFWELQKKQNDLESYLKEDICFKNLWKTCQKHLWRKDKYNLDKFMGFLNSKTMEDRVFSMNNLRPNMNYNILT